MNKITGEALVSCYVDAAALLAMLLLILLSRRLRRQNSKSMRLFDMLCACVTANCILPFIYNAMYQQQAPWCHTAAVIAKTLRECVVLLIIAIWLIYVYRRLYGENRRYTAVLRLVILPFGVFFVLLMVNLFNGMLFTFSAENRFEPKVPLYVIFAVEFLYFCSSAAMVRAYDRKTRKTRSIHVSPMIISVALASGVQFFLPYDTGIMGYVAGITLLYYSMIGEYRYVDEETGMYNRGYLAYLFDMALLGKSDPHSALILETEGDLPACTDIMRALLHQDDVIRAEENKFLVFSGESSRTTLQYLSSMVDEAAEKHNREHPDQKIRILTRCRMRTAGEDAFTFLRTVMDEKESGDEMKGIVSMISELDRLDKELKLAADIQSSILPMNFPAFPEHTEFDLYASMTPAKEVGGDFYDFFMIDGSRLGMVIADVSGKGVPASLFMMVSKTLIKNQLMGGADPAAALERVNLQLCERNSSMMFVTVWAAVLDISTGRGMACNAGHENPALRRAGGGFGILRYKHSMFLGASKAAKFESHEFDLQAGDCLFVYTDGVPEAINEAEKMFGEERMIRTLNEDPDAGPEELIRRVHGAVDRFADHAPQFDDITMLCLKYRGTTEEGQA